MRTGIFGGTFNPVHCGHLHIAQVFTREMNLDQVLWIPTYQPPHKESRELAGAEHRLEMCRLACKEDPRYKVCDLEIRRGGKSYTADTLRELSRLYPENRWVLLMGEDMFLTLLHWYHPEEILALAEICAVPRSQDDSGLLQRMQQQAEAIAAMGGTVRICPAEYWAVSSTEIGEKLRQGKTVSGLIPPSVEQYITQKGLYGKEEIG